MQDRPVKYPSEVAKVPEQRLSFSETYRLLKEYADFRLLLICFMLSNGQFSAFGAIMGDLLVPFLISPSVIAVMACIFILIGVVLSAFVSKRLDGTSSYRQTQLTMLFFISFFLGLMLLKSFYEVNRMTIIVCTIMMCAF